MDMSRRKKSHRLAEAVSRITEFPMESICSVPVFCIKGRNEVEITGCRGVLEYDETKVVVKTCGDVFTVLGSRLILSDFHNDVLLVRGRIDTVCLTTDNKTEVSDV